jgi:protein gp37
MGKNSSIEWTRHTFNPWQGCVKVSAGCAHCYAETLSRRWGNDIWGADKPRKFQTDAYWRQPLAWDRDAAAAGEVHWVFCASMADWAERHRNPDTQAKLHEARSRLADLIEQTPNLLWLLLTKRPSNAAICFDEMFERHIPPNVLLGISAENQEEFDRRIAIAQEIYHTTTLRGVFISAEPLLGRIVGVTEHADAIRWVIVGGESGASARPMHPDWARSLRDECVGAGIPFFMKQMGGTPDKRRELEDMPEDLRIREFPAPEVAR